MQRPTLILSQDSAMLPRPTTREGDVSSPLSLSLNIGAALPPQPAKDKDRKSSFSRKATSFTSAARRRGSSTTTTANANAANANAANAAEGPSSASSSTANFITDATAPPALPDYALSSAAKYTPRPEIDDPFIRSLGSPIEQAKMLSRTTTNMSMPPPPTPIGGGNFWQGSEATGAGFRHLQDTIRKRMATMDYLRKAHAGRCYWFNAYLMDKADLHRVFDQRKLARRATNYLLLGISLPVLADLYASTPVEFLRALTGLLNEFESFQALRNESSASAITRARLPTMFRRPGGKSRRSTSVPEDDAAYSSSSYPLASGSLPSAPAPSVMNFAASESDLLPAEEYTYLLTPSLPFEPDYFETFATLCDALNDVYNRILMLVPTMSGCTPAVMEHFAKADARVRKILVAGVVKEFEESSRANIKAEVASVGKVVLGGLM